MRGERSIFSSGGKKEELVERGEERVDREAQTSLYDIRSSVAWFSSGQELKSIYVMRAMHGYWKQRISPKIQAKSSGDREFRVFGTSESFVFAPRCKDSSCFHLFSIIEAVLLSFNALGGYLAVFALRGCLAK